MRSRTPRQERWDKLMVLADTQQELELFAALLDTGELEPETREVLGAVLARRLRTIKTVLTTLVEEHRQHSDR